MNTAHNNSMFPQYRHLRHQGTLRTTKKRKLITSFDSRINHPVAAFSRQIWSMKVFWTFLFLLLNIKQKINVYSTPLASLWSAKAVSLAFKPLGKTSNSIILTYARELLCIFYVYHGFLSSSKMKLWCKTRRS